MKSTTALLAGVLLLAIAGVQWLVRAEDPRATALPAAERKAEAPKATGIVFHDANMNQKLDDGEKRLAGIRVSNGEQIVETDKQGR